MDNGISQRTGTSQRTKKRIRWAAQTLGTSPERVLDLAVARLFRDISTRPLVLDDLRIAMETTQVAGGRE